MRLFWFIRNQSVLIKNIQAVHQTTVEWVQKYMKEVDSMKSGQDWDTQQAKIYQANKDRIDY